MGRLQELGKRLGQLTTDRYSATAKNGEIINLRQVCFITWNRSDLYRFSMMDGRVLELKVEPERLEELLSNEVEGFERFEINTWGNLRWVEHAKKAPNSRYLLYFQGESEPATVSRHYAPSVAEALGVETLDHITPISQHGKDVRSLELLDLGEAELKKLETEDEAAVQDFFEKFDIRKYSPQKLRELFSYDSNEKVEKSKLLSNLIWQQWLWIQKGIHEPIIGNIKTFWYQNSLKSLFESVGYSTDELDPAMIYPVFEDFISLRLITYREFGFVDNLESNRGIGETLPHVMVYAEKEGQHTMINHLAEEYGCSRLATKGQIPYITMEYFTREIHKKVSPEKPLRIFAFVDFNPDGHDILRNLGIKLQFYGITNFEIIPLITLDEYTDDQIQEASSKLVTVHEYKTADGTLKYPAYEEKDEDRHKEVTDWYYGSEIWPGILDKRLTLRKPHPEKGEIVTILGLDLDMFGYYGLKNIFYKKAKEFLGENAPLPLPAKNESPQLQKISEKLKAGIPVDFSSKGKDWILLGDGDLQEVFKDE